MKPFELKVARMKAGLSQEDMAKMLGISQPTYGTKERGESPFRDSEKIIVAEVLNLDATQVNDYFFDGKMPKE